MPISGPICNICNQPISASRLEALPHTTICTSCKGKDDEPPITGYMSWEHKTAPTLITSLAVGDAAIRALHHFDRKGVHASLPLSSPKNPRIASSLRAKEGEAEFDSIRFRQESPTQADLEPTNIVVARCHPTQPAVTPDKKCLECALHYYAVRVSK